MKPANQIFATIVISDIFGTYTKGLNATGTRDEALSNFVNKLELLKGDNLLVFSFISSDEESIINNCIKELNPFLKNKMIWGINYSEHNQICNGKSIIDLDYREVKVYKAIKEYQKKYYIDKVYYFDDQELNIILINHFIKKYLPDITFIPILNNNQLGLSGLNANLDQLVNNIVLKK